MRAITRPGGPPILKRGERGQILVLALLSMVLLISGVSLGADTSRMLEERRAAQIAVDHAATAAAHAFCLGANESAARAAGRLAAQRNGYDDAAPTIAVAVDPVSGPGSTIRAVITSTIPGTFSRIVGIDRFTITVEATVTAEGCEPGSGGPGAIYGGGTCEPGKGVDLPGSNMTVVGAVHTNADLIIGGSNNDYDEVTFVDARTVSGANISYASSPPVWPRDVGPSLPSPVWPARWSPSDASPTLFAAYKVLAAANGRDYHSALPPSTIDRDGVWFTSSTAEWTINQVLGTRFVVLVSQNGEISLSGNNADIRAWSHSSAPRPGILILSGKTHAGEADKCSKHTIKLSGQDWDWSGIMWAPGGLVEFSGSDSATGNGSLIAWGVKLAGQHISITRNPTLFPPVSPRIYVRQ